MHRRHLCMERVYVFQLASQSPVSRILEKVLVTGQKRRSRRTEREPH